MRESKSYTARLDPGELAVLSVMRDYPLQPGQMLIFGPKSVNIIKMGSFAGKLPDRLVLKENEWKDA